MVGVYAKDNLPDKIVTTRGPLAMIVNSANASSIGEHWMLIFIYPSRKQLIFWDSLGHSPSFYGGELEKWVNVAGYNVITSQRPVQSKHSIYCGLFVMFVLYFLSRGVSLSVIMKKFASNTNKNDWLVSKFGWQRLKFMAKKEIKRDSDFHSRAKLDYNLIMSENYF